MAREEGHAIRGVNKVSDEAGRTAAIEQVLQRTLDTVVVISGLLVEPTLDVGFQPVLWLHCDLEFSHGIALTLTS
jgi:hypothetical protein